MRGGGGGVGEFSPRVPFSPFIGADSGFGFGEFSPRSPLIVGCVTPNTLAVARCEDERGKLALSDEKVY